MPNLWQALVRYSGSDVMWLVVYILGVISTAVGVFLYWGGCTGSALFFCPKSRRDCQENLRTGRIMITAGYAQLIGFLGGTSNVAVFGWRETYADRAFNVMFVCVFFLAAAYGRKNRNPFFPERQATTTTQTPL